jgi:hypothetical protein
VYRLVLPWFTGYWAWYKSLKELEPSWILWEVLNGSRISFGLINEEKYILMCLFVDLMFYSNK